MEERDFYMLAQRIGKLERQTTVLKRLLGVSLVLVFAALADGATIAQQRQMSFSSGDGSVKVNGSGISLYDTSGRRRLELGWNSASQPGVYFSDARGTTRMGLFLSDSSSPVVRLYSGSGANVADFAEGTSGYPGLFFYDSNHVQRAYMGMSSTDDPIADIWDSSSIVRTHMGQYSDGSYGFNAKDSSGSVLWQSP